MPFGDLRHPGRAADVGEDRRRLQRRSELEQRRLGLIEEHELAKAEPREPLAQRRADRAAGAGDERRGAGEVAGEGVVADVEDGPPEQGLGRGLRATVPCSRARRARVARPAPSLGPAADAA
jgi:hypothetical protein